MKKLLALFVGLGLLSQSAHAVLVMGENFAGYVNDVTGTSGPGTVVIDTGVPDASGDPTYSSDINASITDTDAGTWVIGNAAGAYLNLGFTAGVVNGVGDDLKIFLVGGNGHKVDLEIGGIARSYTLDANIGSTGAFDPMYDTYPIVGLGVDLSDFTGLAGPVTGLKYTVNYGWCDDSLAPCSSVPSFVGAYNVVPVPAAVWLFGSGLIGLVGIARRKQK